MRDGVVGCTPDTPLTEVARLMSEYRIHCVVVAGLEEDAHGTHLVWGVVSDLDLARAAAAGRGAHRGPDRRDRAGHRLALRHAGRRRPRRWATTTSLTWSSSTTGTQSRSA